MKVYFNNDAKSVVQLCGSIIFVPIFYVAPAFHGIGISWCRACQPIKMILLGPELIASRALSPINTSFVQMFLFCITNRVEFRIERINRATIRLYRHFARVIQFFFFFCNANESIRL